MKKNRNMFYSNNQAGGFYSPMQSPMMPAGFNSNNNYMSYGPNVGPNGAIAPYNEPQYGYEYEGDLESRLSKLERQVRKLETRLSKIESSSEVIIEDTANNMYMI